jgi:putative hydrolase of the HAD superfamily
LGLSTIKNLIFDLGGVIIDLDFQAAYQHFADLSGLTVNEVVARTEGLMLFLEYEKGLVTSEEFRKQMRILLEISASDHSIDRAWCAMLGGIPQNRLKLLKSLKPNYRTFALSNTNDIHVRKFNSIVEKSLGNDSLLSDHFEKIYFSHQMKMRKPDVEIYQTVLSEQQLLPEETLFIDDNHENIVGAASLGIKTFHLPDPDQLITYFNGAR